jgi:hypothetical protein
MQSHLLPVDVQPVLAHSLSEGIEGSPQGSPAPGAIVFGPQEVDKGIAPLALSCHGQVGHQGDSLAPVHLDRRAVEFNTRRA